MTKKLKILIIAIVILVLVALIIWYFSKPSENAGKNVVPTVGNEVTQNNQLSQAKDILDVLSLLKTINLNLDFFDNVAFKSLYDFSVQLPVSEVGKNNPFAP